MPGNMAFHGWFDRIRSRCSREGAQTMAEYAVTLAVITPAIRKTSGNNHKSHAAGSPVGL